LKHEIAILFYVLCFMLYVYYTLDLAAKIRENNSMKYFKTIVLVFVLAFSLVAFKGKVVAQTTTLTPTTSLTTTLTPTTTATVTASLTVTPTKVTSLPKTGIAQFTGVFFAVSVGIILVALVF